LAQQRLQRIAPDRHAAEQEGGEAQVDHRRLHVDEPRILEDQRQRAEHQRGAAGHQGHRRDPLLVDKADDQGDRGAHDEARCRLHHVAGDEERQQEDERSEVVDESPDPPVRLAAAHASSRPTSERAKARARNGCRSSIPSPTPISLIGESEAWATGTSTPPRAVPSSLVITMPVTPIWLPKMFSWASALRPTVASSTSNTSCGASGSTFLITRMIFRS